MCLLLRRFAKSALKLTANPTFLKLHITSTMSLKLSEWLSLCFRLGLLLVRTLLVPLGSLVKSYSFLDSGGISLAPGIQSSHDDQASATILSAEAMEPSVLQRYADKIKYIKMDPYNIPPSKWSKEESLFPEITYPDIFDYMVCTTSFYTSENFKVSFSFPLFCYSIVNIILL